MEPARPRTSRVQRAGIAAGVTAVLVGVTLAVTLRPGEAPRPATQALTATSTLRAEAFIRAEERTSRSRPRSPVTSSPAPVRTKAPAPKVVAKRWATTDVNVRSAPTGDAERLGSLKALSRVGVTGRTKAGWSQVVLDGRAGWVKAAYLAKTKPKPEPKAASGVSAASCSISPSIEQHLTANARGVYRAVCDAYGSSVSSFGGYRAGDSGDHGSGRAVDIMVSGAPGTTIARYVQAHAGQLHVAYVIYQQKIWMAGDPAGRWKAMADRGSTTANHYDHVHVSVR